MPWNQKSFKKHNKKATGRRGAKAAKIANAVLEKTGDDGKAIRIASAYLKSHGKHNAAGPGPHGLSSRPFGFKGGGGTHAGSHAPRPGARGHRFTSLSKPPGGGLIGKG